MDTKNIFRPDRNQALAVVAMLAAVFAFAVGEYAIGFTCFGVAAIFSLGGLFWNAHRADKAEAAEFEKANAARIAAAARAPGAPESDKD